MGKTSRAQWLIGGIKWEHIHNPSLTPRTGHSWVRSGQTGFVEMRHVVLQALLSWSEPSIDLACARRNSLFQSRNWREKRSNSSRRKYFGQLLLNNQRIIGPEHIGHPTSVRGDNETKTENCGRWFRIDTRQLLLQAKQWVRRYGRLGRKLTLSKSH